MLSKIRVFPITSYGTDGFPVYGEPVKLHTPSGTEKEINAVGIDIVYDEQEKKMQGDDRQEIHYSTMGYTATPKIYGIDKAALSELYDILTDKNGDQINYVNTGTVKHFGVFFEGKCGENDKLHQRWLYDLTAKKPSDSYETESGTAATISLTFNGCVLTGSDGKQFTDGRVYQGSAKWVSGEPTANDIFKGVTA